MSLKRAKFRVIKRFFLFRIGILVLFLSVSPDVFGQHQMEILSNLFPEPIETTELLALLNLDRNPETPVLSEDGLEIDFILEYLPLGRRYITVYIVDDDPFLPLFDLFNLFKINIEYSSSQRIVSGFYINEDIEYSIDFIELTIQVGNRTGIFNNDDVRVGNNGFYLNPKIFSEMFDLNFDVEPSRLRLGLQTDVKLPILALRERETARSQIHGISDGRDFYRLEFPRNRKIFGSGFLDYQISGMAFNSLQNNSQMVSTTYGFEFLGGDMSGQLNLNRAINGTIRTSTDLSTWRYVVSDNPYLTTIRAGNVPTQGLSGGRVRGVSFTNEPLYTPEIFDVYPVFGITEPRSQVELLLNNQLVDFVTVDESGEYELFVPIRYGNTTLEVVEYLPNGRIRRELIDLRIPGTFLSPGEIRYSGTVGLEENGNGISGIDTGSREDMSGSIAVSAGLSRRLTATQTIYYRENVFDPWPEYSSTLNARIGRSYLVSASAAPGSRYDLQLSTLSVSNFTFSGGYTFFETGNLQNRNTRQQASGGLSFPLRFFQNNPILLSFNGNYNDIRADGNRFNYRTSIGFTVLSLRLRATYRDHLGSASSSFSGDGARATYSASTNTSNLPFISRWLGRVSLTANLDHDVENRQFTNFSMRAYKSFSSRSSLNATFDRNMISNLSTLQVGLQIRFNSARSTTNTRISENSQTLTQTISGSIGYDDHFRHFLFSERNLVGSSAVSVVQFLDTNANGVYDKGEEILDFDGLGFVTGGQRKLGSDGVLRLWQLPAYRQVNMSIDNIRNPNPTAVTGLDQFSIYTDPNRFKLIEIPYDYSGVAIGGIYQVNRGVKEGLGGARFIIRSVDGDYEIEERTFSDGGFYVMDIPPGDYILELSPLLVSFMNVDDQVTQTEFTITPRDGGDFVDGVEIVLEGIPLLEPEPKEPIFVEKRDPFVYQVQAGSFVNRRSAERLAGHLNENLEDKFMIYYSEFTNQFSVRTDTLHQKEGAIEIQELSRKLLNHPDIFSLPDPFLVYLNRNYYDSSSIMKTSHVFYAVQAGVFNSRIRADALAEQIDGQVVRLPSEHWFRVFTNIFTSFENAEANRKEKLQDTSLNHSEFTLTRLDVRPAQWPKPVMYRVQYATFFQKYRADALANSVNGIVELTGENLHRVISKYEKPFNEMNRELNELGDKVDRTDILLLPIGRNPMSEVHRIVYSLSVKDQQRSDIAFNELCAILQTADCRELISEYRVDNLLMLFSNTVNARFILAIDDERERLEKYYKINFYMEQIPVRYLLEID